MLPPRYWNGDYGGLTMSGHGQGYSLARRASRTPSSAAEGSFAAESFAVKAPTTVYTLPPSNIVLDAIAHPNEQQAPSGPSFPGFRHLLENGELIPFKVHGRPVDESPQANNAMRELMRKLALRMQSPFQFPAVLPNGNGASVLDNPLVPSGYTYLLQLAGHDLVHSMASLAVVGNGANGVANSRRSGLRLDTIYGDGPDICPFAYTQHPEGADSTARGPRTRLRLGRIKNKDGKVQGDCPLRDIARAAVGNSGSAAAARVPLTDPLIADPRNDTHAILSQLTALFHQLHNKLLARIAPPDVPIAGHAHSPVEAAYDHFFAVRTAVTLIYRSILRADVLQKILRKEVYDLYRQPDRPQLERWDGRIPLEFSHAAFRFGHAMIRPSYMTNSAVPRDTVVNMQLSSSRFPAVMPLNEQWVVQWSRFFLVGGHERNYSRRIAPHYGPPLVEQSIFGPIDEIGKTAGLAYLDLLSNAHAGLWSVPKLMEKIGGSPAYGSLLARGFANFWKPELTAWLADPRYRGELTDGDIETLSSDPPLLFFVLFEAAREANGAHLGTLGSIIVAEVFFGALEADKLSLERDNATLKDALRGLAQSVLKRPDAFAFVPEISSMPELIAFMVDELKVGSEAPSFI